MATVLKAESVSPPLPPAEPVHVAPPASSQEAPSVLRRGGLPGTICRNASSNCESGGRNGRVCRALCAPAPAPRGAQRGLEQRALGEEEGRVRKRVSRRSERRVFKRQVLACKLRAIKGAASSPWDVQTLLNLGDRTSVQRQKVRGRQAGRRETTNSRELGLET